jgi:hypothetical protein
MSNALPKARGLRYHACEPENARIISFASDTSVAAQNIVIAPLPINHRLVHPHPQARQVDHFTSLARPPRFIHASDCTRNCTTSALSWSRSSIRLRFSCRCHSVNIIPTAHAVRSTAHVHEAVVDRYGHGGAHGVASGIFHRSDGLIRGARQLAQLLRACRALLAQCLAFRRQGFDSSPHRSLRLFCDGYQAK